QGIVLLWILLFSYRNCTSAADQVISCIGGCKVHECLCCFAQFGCGVGYDYEWSLNLIAAVLYGFLGASYTADGDSFDAFLTFHRGQRCITDCIWVTFYCFDNCAGGGQFLAEQAGIFGAGDRLKTISCTGT